MNTTKVIEKIPESKVVIALAKAMRNIAFYAFEHPVVRENLEEVSAAVSQQLESKREFVLKIVEGEIIANDRPLFDLETGTANLVGACLRREIESIAFRPGVTTKEITALIAVLSTDPEELAHLGGATQSLTLSGVTHIAAEKLQTAAFATRDDGDELARRKYVSALDVLRAAARRARLGMAPEITPANQAISELIDTIMFDETAMLALVSVKGRDEYTFTHALHICILCLELGHSLGLNRAQLQELGVASLLHDVGKIFIPLSILRKPSNLTAEEFAIVQKHPIHGALLLSRQENGPPAAPLVAFEHHLHYDLSGYPKIKRAHPLNFYSLLVGLADVYDALTTDRPYRPPLPPHQALEEMHKEAQHFEPRLLARFTEMLGRYPAGSLVNLADGRLAVVSRPNSRYSDRPFVRLVEGEEGQSRLAEAELDLGLRDEEKDCFLSSIAGVIEPAGAQLDVCSLLGGNPFCTE